MAEKANEKNFVKSDVKQVDVGKLDRSHLNTNLTKLTTQTPSAKPKLGAFHLCNILCHMSQFGSTVDVTLELKLMTLVCGGQIVIVESFVDTKASKPITIRNLSTYRFIEVLKMGLNFTQDSCTVYCVLDIPGVVVNFEGSIFCSFLIKESKRKG
jgi:hypothetical protein